MEAPDDATSIDHPPPNATKLVNGMDDNDDNAMKAANNGSMSTSSLSNSSSNVQQTETTARTLRFLARLKAAEKRSISTSSESSKDVRRNDDSHYTSEQFDGVVSYEVFAEHLLFFESLMEYACCVTDC